LPPISTKLPAPKRARAKIAELEPRGYILAADTVVAVGRRILPKAETDAEVRECLKLLSGRRHHVYTGVALRTESGKTVRRVSDTAVKFKQLTNADIELYLKTREGLGKAGGYAIQGLAATYAQSIMGSYSNIVGLPLFDVAQMLRGNGYNPGE
jgi:septum formation protein